MKSAPADDYLQIAVVLAGKRRLMDRPKSEALQKTLARMQKNAMPPTGDQSYMALHGATPRQLPRASLEQAVPPMVACNALQKKGVLMAYRPCHHSAAVTHAS